MEQEKKEILMVRKPLNLKEVRERIDRKITPSDIVKIVGNKIGKSQGLVCENWEELNKTILNESQFWVVDLKQESVKLLIDTQGFNYPRYVGILEDN